METSAERTRYLDVERRSMDAWSEHYDRAFDLKYDHYILRLEVAKMARRLLDSGVDPGVAKVLDVGCGPGNLIGHLLSEGFGDVAAIDISPQMIEVARSKFPAAEYPQIDLRVGTFEEEHFEEGVYDVVTAFSSIHHLQDPLAAVEKIRRLLKPGGVFLCNEPNERSSIYRYLWLGRAVRVLSLPLLLLLRIKNAAIWRFNRRIGKDPRLELPEHHKSLDPSFLDEIAALGFERCAYRETGVMLAVVGQMLSWSSPFDRMLGHAVRAFDRLLESFLAADQFTAAFRKTGP